MNDFLGVIYEELLKFIYFFLAGSFKISPIGRAWFFSMHAIVCERFVLELFSNLLRNISQIFGHIGSKSS